MDLKAGTACRLETETTHAGTAKNSRRYTPCNVSAIYQKFPDIAAAHEAIARSIDRQGPLDRKTCELIKLGISIGAGLITATQSHTRRARKEGASLEEIEQAILLTMNTCGFPRTVAAWQWARQALTPR